MAQTLADTASWDAARPSPADGVTRPAVGLAPERERELMKAWASGPGVAQRPG
jgi:hypothetical protein